MSRKIQCPLCIKIKQFFLALDVLMQCLLSLIKAFKAVLKEFISVPKACFTIYLILLAPNISHHIPLPQPTAEQGQFINVNLERPIIVR